ncbi:MAG: alanine racemase [Deltaproteobacteria bacterium]|nr:alanine racemase [Deltaproteobacteria bacterium]
MGTTARLDDCLSTRDGHLYVEECDTVALVERFGSPLFVISEDQLRRNVRRFRDAFQQGWPDGPVKVMPAAKANWVTAAQRVLADEGCGCDVYSPGELSVALAAGFEPRFISVNGVPKEPAQIRRAVQHGARITIDSVEELDHIAAAASELGTVARVRLRLKPALSGFIEPSQFVPEGLVPTDIVALAYKGGLSFDEAKDLGLRIRALTNVELVGFHQHHGRHVRGLAYWEEQMRAYARELGRICRALGGYQPEEIDIGGGFAIPRDPHNAATDYTAPLQLGFIHLLSKGLSLLGPERRYGVLARIIDTLSAKPNAVAAPSIEAYAETCTRTLREELPKHGIRTQGLMLQLEPGRSIHGDAGVHLATVRGIKRMRSPIRWNLVALDTTEFWMTGGRYEHHLHDYRIANKTDLAYVDRVDVVGRSCYGDRLMPTMAVPGLEVGDLFAFLDAGAYQEVSASNFNALPRPAAVLVRGSEAFVVRTRETEADVFRRDQVPDHLQRRDAPSSRPTGADTSRRSSARS